jgi:hypothetical protein
MPYKRGNNVLDLKCPECGHLKVFHHEVDSEKCCKKLKGCHFTIENKKDKWIECDCKEIY